MRQLFSNIQSSYDLDVHVQANFSYNKIEIMQKPQTHNSRVIQKVILQNQDIKTRGLKPLLEQPDFNISHLQKSRSQTQYQEMVILPGLEVKNSILSSISPLKVKRQESRAITKYSLPFRNNSAIKLQ
ncbi:Hypothetical_protein [Hexamita inflata]|uniref:Hypothetical_protein n=1 Tax=Hexamita inflata TaxID=28002 RepID=A0AA86T972_9EUKA|nr:Hypothetical protein HINF_LOCUS419 [Hexamita inflata]